MWMAVQASGHCQVEQEGNNGIPSGSVSGMPLPGSDAELEEDKTDTGCSRALWFSVSDFPLRQLR